MPKSAAALDLSGRKTQPAPALLTQQTGHQQSSGSHLRSQAIINMVDRSLKVTDGMNAASRDASPATDSPSPPNAETQETLMVYLAPQHPSWLQSYRVWWGTARKVFVIQPVLMRCQHIARSVTQTMKALASHMDSLSSKQLTVCHSLLVPSSATWIATCKLQCV